MNSKSLFGTSGIRGIVGQDLTTELCTNVARALGSTLPHHAHVCIATDSRFSAEIIKTSIVSGLLSSGTHVTELGILPTPMLAFLTRDLGFDTGLMVTASHNPPEYNGIKFFERNGVGYSKAQEIELEKKFREKQYRSSHSGNVTTVHGVQERYYQFLRDKFLPTTINRDLKLVIDPGNGAASQIATELFTSFGFSVLSVNDKPDGRFPNRSPEPKEDTLHGTIEILRKNQADIAVCFDGDADRVVFCDKDGFLGFNEPIAFISRLIVEQTGKRKVATTVESGRMIDLALEDLGIDVVRGKVGDVNVAWMCKELDAPVGVEEAGVYIVPKAGYYPDPFVAILTLLDGIKSPQDIRNFFKNLPAFVLKKEKVSCPNGLKSILIDKVKVDGHSIGALRINDLDGLRFEFEDAWLLIRASGTEPVIRVMVEAESIERANALMDKGMKVVQENLGELQQ